MLEAIIFVLCGLGLLAFGADRFVDGALSLSVRFRISPMIVGVVVVGFATSAPELLVSTIAALESHPTLSIGNAIGSNIANIGLVLGVTALVFPLQIKTSLLKIEFPIMLAGLLLSSLLMLDLNIGLVDGFLFLVGLLFLLSLMVFLNGNAEDESFDKDKSFILDQEKEVRIWRAFFLFLGGLVLLLIGSEMLVKGAVLLAKYFGATDVFIGLTIVAVGTSLPELAASLASAFKKATDLAIGNIIGSNLFNALGVVAMPALFHPFSIDIIILQRDVGVMWLLTLLLLMAIIISRKKGKLDRLPGLMFLLSFIFYQITLFLG
tara:strand:- start:2861 stop:3823 length:963 start_codon:yes stop_codon:yes gene_type:complete